jgi:hypothetical protein
MNGDNTRAKAVSMIVILCACIGGMVWLAQKPPSNDPGNTSAIVVEALSPFLAEIRDAFPGEVDELITLVGNATSNAAATSYSEQSKALRLQLEGLQIERDRLAKIVSLERSILATMLKETGELQRKLQLRDNMLAFIIGVGSSLSATGLIVLIRRSRRNGSQPRPAAYRR